MANTKTKQAGAKNRVGTMPGIGIKQERLGISVCHPFLSGCDCIV